MPFQTSLTLQITADRLGADLGGKDTVKIEFAYNPTKGENKLILLKN